ncbi:MAG: TonB-dependent receptor [Acidobacteria bacterium]|nr:TonB-dependent receptor [Acidobacteriota bacterium]
MITGAEVTATNVDTGVETRTTTNNAGVYNFASLQPGTYRVSAQAAGFQVRTVTDMRLRMGVSASQNFELAVAGTTTEVEVTGISESMVLDAGSSTGTVLQEQLITELPLVSNDVMDLLNLMGGVVAGESPIFNAFEQTFAGVAAAGINVSRDGVSISEVRYTSGIVSPARINQDMVGEFKMILSPVDAELGRGAGQVQIMTRSGSNSFHGSGVWNIQNTALDAREWEAKRTGEEPAWRNLHNYSVSVGGPIIKNKTFFFATWDHQIVREKSSVTAVSLTNCAKLGIYRYFDGWVNLNGNATASFVAPGGWSLPARPVVDRETGAPLYSYTDPISNYMVNQSPADLKFESVMGALTPEAKSAIAEDPVNCTGYQRYVGGAGGALSNSNYGITAPWSSLYRNKFDESGYVQKFTAMVPEANSFDNRDGMNIAGHKWTRTVKGANTVFGTGQDGERKAVSTRIDHNINSEHRLSGTYNFEYLIGEDGQPIWDNEYGFGGNITRKPQAFTVGLTSTLKPTLLNEFRLGFSRTYAMINTAYTANPDALSSVLYDLLPVSKDYIVPVGYDDLGYTYGYGWTFTGTSHPFGTMGYIVGAWGGSDHRWTISDTLTWMKGAHSFKGGFEIRFAQSRQVTDSNTSFAGSASPFPTVGGGVMKTSEYDGSEFTDWNGLAGDPTFSWTMGNITDVRNMLNYFSGSVAGARQFFYPASTQGGGRWNNLLNGEIQQVSDLRNREFAFFFKDDWRVNNDLTLNLGFRYEYYGVPWENQGMTTGLVGGPNGIWGAYGSGSFDNFMPNDPGAVQYKGDSALARYQFIGPNSPNPGLSLWNKDLNNFAPHVGFSWQLPWFGKGLTTLRGGYSISYTPLTNFDGFAGSIAKVPGILYYRQIGSTSDLPYLTLNDLKNNSYNGKPILPLAAPDDPSVPAASRFSVLQTYPVTHRQQSYTVYDENIRSPYVQNINLSLTRQVGNYFTVDVRYIGTLSRKNISSINLNTANFVNNGLYEEFKKVRKGEQSTVFNNLIPSNSLVENGFDWETFEPVQYTGSEQLLRYTDYSNFFALVDFGASMAQGSFSSVAGTLATVNGNLQNVTPEGVRGAVLRSGTWKGQSTPENLIYANPQLAGASITSNALSSNYHSMQAQVTMRPVHGLSFQTTYTWSRNLARQGITDYNTMQRNYYLSGQHRSHTLNSYGSYDLPIGTKGYVFRDAAGAFKKAIDGWQLSWILSISSGMPGSLSGGSTLWGDSRPILERPDLWDNKAGKVSYRSDSDDYYGYFFGNKYVRVTDPVCNDTNVVAASLAVTCANGRNALALAEPDGGSFRAQTYTSPYTGASGVTYNIGDPVIVVRNARYDLGEDFNNSNKMNWNGLTGPARWSFDLAMSKGIEFMEGKRIEVRVDAQNVFNHPMPSNYSFSWNARFTQIYNPEFDLNGTNPTSFGRLTSKGGHRTFQAKIRLSF